MKRYVLTLLASCLAVLGLAGLFNYLVDPYLLFHHRDGDAKVFSRIDQFWNMRGYKPYHVMHKAPKNLVIGTSRSAAIWPETARWKAGESYNFAIPGMTLFELSRSVQHAHAVQPLSELVVGIDYQAVVRSSTRYRFGFEPDRLLRKPSDRYSPAHIGQVLVDLHTFLLSYGMLAESVKTRFLHEPVPRIYYPNGVWEKVSNKLVGYGGYQFVARSALKSMNPDELQPAESLPYFRELLRFCHANDIDTRLLLTPTHVFFVDLWFQVGSEQLWRETHRQLVKINEEVAAEFGRDPFPFWAFGDESRIVDEPIYRSRDADKGWFLDGVHSSSKLARRMMSSVQGEGRETFGHRLDSGNIDAYLDGVNALRAGFVRREAQDVEKLRDDIGLRAHVKADASGGRAE